MTYDPQVDDYVIWKRPSGDWDEGWVYFKGDPVDNEIRNKQAVSYTHLTLPTIYSV